MNYATTLHLNSSLHHLNVILAEQHSPRRFWLEYITGTDNASLWMSIDEEHTHIVTTGNGIMYTVVYALKHTFQERN
jgi:hypothetical protein